MYFPSSNSLALAGEDFSVWAPADHQRVIAKLTAGLGVLFYREKAIALELLPKNDARRRQSQSERRTARTRRIAG